MSMQRPIGVAGRQLGGFQKFLLRGNVIDLAVAVVIGVAFTAVVTAFVKDLLTPFLGVFGGTPDFSQVYFTINSSRFLIGEFINALLSLLIVALVLYFFVVAPVNALMERGRSQDCTGHARVPRVPEQSPSGRSAVRVLHQPPPSRGDHDRLIAGTKPPSVNL
jgi:large conductance mechanosensitive channel